MTEELHAKVLDANSRVDQAAAHVNGGEAWPGFETTLPATQAPPAWRAPEGPEGKGGLRDRPLRAVRLACGDLAGGRARRCPEHQRRYKQQRAARTARARWRSLAGLQDDTPSDTPARQTPPA